MQKIVPHLWFNNQAEEAVQFYVSLFKNSKISKTSRYGEAGAKASGQPKGAVMTIAFELEGQSFVALNGGPHFSFSPAISFMVSCNTQEELDVLWTKLSADPAAEQCGWLKDKYGISWQLVPAMLSEIMGKATPAQLENVMKAMMPMKKLDVQALQQAYKQ